MHMSGQYQEEPVTLGLSKQDLSQKKDNMSIGVSLFPNILL
jgi:hypothetical protein